MNAFKASASGFLIGIAILCFADFFQKKKKNVKTLEWTCTDRNLTFCIFVQRHVSVRDQAGQVQCTLIKKTGFAYERQDWANITIKGETKSDMSPNTDQTKTAVSFQ